MNHTRRNLIARVGLGAVLLAACMHAQVVHAKVSAAPNKDGSPTDPKAEQEAQEYNDLLDGPKDGQSYDDWAEELDALHQEMYGTPLAIDLDSGGLNGTADSSPDTGSPGTDSLGTDMCLTPLHDWVRPAADETTAEGIEDAATATKVKNNLEAFLLHMLKIQAAGTDAVISRPKITQLACEDDATTSALTIDVPVAWDVPLLDVNFHAANIHMHASVLHREIAFSEWCVLVHDYQFTGVDPLVLPLVKPRIKIIMEASPFCGPEFAPTPAR